MLNDNGALSFQTVPTVKVLDNYYLKSGILNCLTEREVGNCENKNR